MSFIEYNSLLLKISQKLAEQNVADLVFLCRGKITGNEQSIDNVRSLFVELEDHNHLGIDRLGHLKELLKAVKEWSLLKEVKSFEIKRKEYNELLQQISEALDESSELEQLISLCRGRILVENERNISDARTLFKELEKNNNLGIGRLDILKEVLNVTEQQELLQRVEEFERRRDQEDEFESRRGDIDNENKNSDSAQTAAMVASVRSLGGSVIRVLNMKTIFKVGEAGLTLLSMEQVLSHWSTYDQLVTCFTSCVLPAGTQLIQISQGCVCFTIRADSLTALSALWNMYMDGSLKQRLHDFFVTEEMRKLAGSEGNVEVTVTIEKEEYEKACFEFIREAEGKQPRRTGRRNSDSALTGVSIEDEVTLLKLNELEYKFKVQQERIEILEREMEMLPKVLLGTEKTSKEQAVGGVDWAYLDPEKRAYVQSFVENLGDTNSAVTETSDSGLGSSYPPSEIESEATVGEEKRTPPVPRSQETDTVATKIKAILATHKEDHTARQADGNGGLRPPRRPDHGTVGRPIKLRANFFRLNISPKLTDMYHYDVDITPEKCPKSVKRDIVNEIVRKFKDSTFQGHEPAFDGEKNLYSRIKLPPAELSVKLAGEDGGRDREFKVKIQCAGAVSLVELKNFLMGKNGRNAQDTVQALDIVLRQIPSCTYTPVGRSFFPMNGHGRPIGEGCEVQFGFYQSVRPSEWKVMLVNIDVSAKGFYKSQDVIDFLCETLEMSPRQLEDPRAHIDKRKFESAIRGIRIETTHVAPMKRKYTVWGVSSSSAERLQFDIEDETTGHQTKTTVAQYFKDRYRLPLRAISEVTGQPRGSPAFRHSGTGHTSDHPRMIHRIPANFPHLPCLQVGQKKDYYLPMEVCTIIPCQKRYLSEQQIANLIRSTARPAPERQRDIDHWAKEMIKSSSKYLKEEFDTSVDQEMVSVDGRVLPAPRVKLGSQDQALVPRDGSWDMRNKALYEGARIDVWALACFAPPQRCNEDTLRKFCMQMSSVSNKEGMKMAAQPAVLRYARNSREVERLFASWMVEHPGMLLIIAVVPMRCNGLYAEIKRVGDTVIGIPTQCVQYQHVQQAKPQVCANICLKINAKLGGVNHVIDSSLKPLFTEPTIVFGADVTHPSPKENGIPSIAAVVASMDHHASKYQARVRAQKHVKGAGAQEIINGLAAIVTELLIEFYKTNGKLKPSKIVFYRDGVSEGQFDQVLFYEVRAVQEACMKLEKGYKPGITFVVVQKRHRTRLFCENPADSSGTGENVPPGTTVDSGITHPYEFDFYLCSHFGIQGTSRPAHYHVLYDDNRFTADSLQQLTYQVCHLYARCTRSVSIPAPAYYAHLAAFRAKCILTDGDVVSQVPMDLRMCTRAIQVNDKMKGVMYFA